MLDDGGGMRRSELARCHDLAATTKVRGERVGFAGVGIKDRAPGLRGGDDGDPARQPPRGHDLAPVLASPRAVKVELEPKMTTLCPEAACPRRSSPRLRYTSGGGPGPSEAAREGYLDLGLLARCASSSLGPPGGSPSAAGPPARTADLDDSPQTDREIRRPSRRGRFGQNAWGLFWTATAIIEVPNLPS
jgi:hypothetical protein